MEKMETTFNSDKRVWRYVVPLLRQNRFQSYHYKTLTMIDQV